MHVKLILSYLAEDRFYGTKFVHRAWSEMAPKQHEVETVIISCAVTYTLVGVSSSF